ncbi:MAG: glycosyltransferase family 9 protein [Candidatus Methanomethylicaceae archaeon]
MKSALIFRGYKAIGDLLFISPAPRILKQELNYDKVGILCWNNNAPVFWNNPYIDCIHMIEAELTETEIQYALDEIMKDYTDLYDFRFTIESTLLFRTDEVMPTLEERRQRNKGVNYYTHSFHKLGWNHPGKPELYFSKEEEETILKFIKGNDLFPYIIWQLYGSSSAKQLVQGTVWIEYISKRYPHINNIIVGNSKINPPRIANLDNVINLTGSLGLRSVLALVKHAILVIGPESSITNAAGAFDVPVIVCFSGATHENLTKYFSRAIPITPKCDCSPCYKISISPKHVWDLRKRSLAWEHEKKCRVQDPESPYRYLGFKCTELIDFEEITRKISRVIADSGHHRRIQLIR